MKDFKKLFKILHCPTTVGGNPQGLATAERALGYNSKSLTIVQNYLNYPADIVVTKSSNSLFKSTVLTWKALMQSLLSYNVIHYNFGETLSPQRIFPRANKYPKWKIVLYNNLYARWFEFLDLRLARLMRKVTAVTYQGDDARQGDYCHRNYELHFCNEVDNSYYTEERDVFTRHKISVFDNNADLIYALNPDLLNVLPDRAKFMPYASVDPRQWEYVGVSGDGNVPHIVHAPSNRSVKGTKYIESAIHRLQQDGINFKFTLVEGMTNEEAKKVYKTADILVDQLLAGFYGALSVELMALGKPVVCYLYQPDIEKYLPSQMTKDIPIVNATPDSIYEVLKKLLTTDRNNLKDIGDRSRKYVETWHDPVKIAQQLLYDYENVWAQKHE